MFLLLDEEYNFKCRSAQLANLKSFNERGHSKSYLRHVDSRSGGSTESIVKIRHQTSANVNKLAKYLSDVEKTKDKSLMYDSYGLHLDKKRFEEMCEQWNALNKADRKKELEADRLRSSDRKYKTRYSTHLVLSLKEKPTKQNIEILRQSVLYVQEKHFSSLGFDSYFVIHQDKPHCHAHLVIHNRNRMTKKKIRFSKHADLYAIRKDFAEQLIQQGLNYTATLKNLDSLEIKNNPAKKKTNRKDYLTNELVKIFGEEIRPYVKKQMIESNLKDERKSARAKENLVLLRDYKNPSSHPLIQSKLDTYHLQVSKFELKKQLQDKFTHLETKDINSYVDMLFSRQKSLLDSAHSKNPESISKLVSIDKVAEGIDNIDASKIIEFSGYLKKKRSQQLKIKNFDRYGPVGSEYLALLNKKREVLLNKEESELDSDLKKQHQQQRKKAEKEILDLTRGNIKPEKIVQSLLNENSKGQRDYVKQRFELWTDEIKQNSGVSPDQSVLKDLYSLYLIRRGNDSKKAFSEFERSRNYYSKVLSSGDQRKLKQFNFRVKADLSVAPTVSKAL